MPTITSNVFSFEVLYTDNSSITNIGNQQAYEGTTRVVDVGVNRGSPPPNYSSVSIDAFSDMQGTTALPSTHILHDVGTVVFDASTYQLTFDLTGVDITSSTSLDDRRAYFRTSFTQPDP